MGAGKCGLEQPSLWMKAAVPVQWGMCVCVCVCVCVYLYTPVHYLGGFSLGIDSTFHCIYCTDPGSSNFISKCDTFKNHIFLFVLLFCNF